MRHAWRQFAPGARKRARPFSLLVSFTTFLVGMSFLSPPASDELIETGGIVSQVKLGIHLLAILVLGGVSLIVAAKPTLARLELIVLLLLLSMSASTVYNLLAKPEVDLLGPGRLIGLFIVIPMLRLSKAGYFGAIRAGILAALAASLLLVSALLLISPDSVYRPVYLGGQLVGARLGGNVIPPNTLAIYFAVAVLLVIYSRFAWAMKFLLCIPLLSLLFMTDSRWGTLSLIFPIIYSYGRRRYGAALIGLVLLPVMAVALSLTALDVTWLARSSDANEIFSLMGRTDLWAQGLDLFLSGNFFQIIFGHGHMLENETFFTGTLRTSSLHNTYLQMLVGNGLFSLLVYLGMLLYFLLRLRKSYASTQYEVILLYVVLNGILELSGFLLMNMSFMLVVLCAAYAVQPIRSISFGPRASSPRAAWPRHGRPISNLQRDDRKPSC